MSSAAGKRIVVIDYLNSLFDSGAAARMGTGATSLCALVAKTQDKIRFIRPVTFTNLEIMNLLGVKKLDTFISLRKKAVESGYLQYTSQSGKRAPGEYSIQMPESSSLPPENGSSTHESLPPKIGRPSTLFPKEDPETLPLTPKGGSGAEDNCTSEPSGKRRAKKASNPPATLAHVRLPDSLNNPSGIQSLETWLDYKRRKRQKYEPLGLQLLVNEVAEWGPQRLEAALNHSMARSYTGLYEPKNSGPGNVHGRSSVVNCEFNPADTSEVRF